MEHQTTNKRLDLSQDRARLQEILYRDPECTDIDIDSVICALLSIIEKLEEYINEH